jgi:DNA-binding SARP family transcriptional activator
LQAITRVAQRHIGARLARGAAREPGVTSARLELFGPPRLLIDGHPVPPSAWRSQRAFQILIYLALHPNGAGRDRLIDAFWPGRRIAAARKNFHPTLSYIRSVLPRSTAAPLRRDAETYRLDPGYPLSCDVWEVHRALDEARRASDPSARRVALERATGLARQPFLEGCYADWADQRQVEMRDRLERAHVELGALLERAGDHEGALASYRAAAEFDAYRESTRAAVIESLVRLGNRRAALVEWDRLKALLHDELGVEPLPETSARVARALSADAAPASATNGEPLVPQPSMPTAQVPLKAHGGR